MAHHLVWFPNPLATGSQMGTLSTHHHDRKPPFLITSTFLGRDSKSPVRESNYLPPPLFVNSFCSFAQEALLKKVSGQESPTPPSLRQTLSADRGYPPLYKTGRDCFFNPSCTSCPVSKLFPCHSD